MPRQAQQAPEPKKQRISVVMALMMVIVVLTVEGVQILINLFHFIPLIGNAIATVVSLFLGFAGSAGFAVWFLLLGVYGTGKNVAMKGLVGLGSLGAEMVPIIDALPFLTAGVVITIILTRLEDGGIGKVFDVASNFVPVGRIAKTAFKTVRGST